MKKRTRATARKAAASESTSSSKGKPAPEITDIVAQEGDETTQTGTEEPAKRRKLHDEVRTKQESSAELSELSEIDESLLKECDEKPAVKEEPSQTTILSLREAGNDNDAAPGSKGGKRKTVDNEREENATEQEIVQSSSKRPRRQSQKAKEISGSASASVEAFASPSTRPRRNARSTHVTMIPPPEMESLTGDRRRRGTRISYVEPDDDYEEDAGVGPSSKPTRRAGGSTPSKPAKGGKKQVTYTSGPPVRIPGTLSMMQPDVEKAKFVPLPELPAPLPGKRKGKIWAKEFLLSDPKSKLADFDVPLTNLVNKAMWEKLSHEEQQECLKLLPEIDKVYAPHANPEEAEVKGLNPSGVPQLCDRFFDCAPLKSALTELQEDIAAGHFQPKYIEQARKAREARLNGATDKFKDGQYELFWGQRSRVAGVAGAAAQIRLSELADQGLLKVGDVWCYRRQIGETLLEKDEIKLIEIVRPKPGEKGKKAQTSLTFQYPPGSHKFSGKGGPDTVLKGVLSPQTLETAILKKHKDTPSHIPNGNAFKVFNIWRRGEMLGALWEIRQHYWGGE